MFIKPDRLLLEMQTSEFLSEWFFVYLSWLHWNLEMLVFEERGKPEYIYPEKKPLGAKERTNKKLNPHMVLKPGFEPWRH